MVTTEVQALSSHAARRDAKIALRSAMPSYLTLIEVSDGEVEKIADDPDDDATDHGSGR